MALNHKDEYYTQWTHTESGEHLNRRIHRLMVQRGDGGFVELVGPDLPDSILTFAGNGHKDLHKAYIYSRGDTSMFMPKFRPSRSSVSTLRSYYVTGNEWPTRRDFIHLIIGIVLLGVIRFIGTASAMGGY